MILYDFQDQGINDTAASTLLSSGSLSLKDIQTALGRDPCGKDLQLPANSLHELSSHVKEHLQATAHNFQMTTTTVTVLNPPPE